MNRRPLSLTALSLAAATAPGVAAEQILVSEFFEEVLSLDGDTGVLTDLVDTPIGETSPFGQHLAVAGDGRMYVTDFGRVFRFDAGAASPYTRVAAFDTTDSFRELTRAASATGLLATNGGGEILSVDPLTGAIETVYDDTFFSVSDLAVDANGRIFATEFFGGLGYLNDDATDFVEIGDFDPLDLDHLDIGADGRIYASTGFDNGFVAIDPATGRSVSLLEDAYDFIDDLRVADDDTLYFAGVVAGEDGIFRLGTDSVVRVDAAPGPDFFNPLDLDLAAATLRVTVVPEPAGLLVLAAAGGLAMLRRRRA